MTRAFYALMKARGKGVIINILGNGGERLDAGYICGSAGNAALMAFTRALGGASHRDGLRVVGINPGPVATERLVGLMRKEAKDRFGTRIDGELAKPFPFQRAATPQEIAANGGVAGLRPLRLYHRHHRHHRRRHGQCGIAHLAVLNSGQLVQMCRLLRSKRAIPTPSRCGRRRCASRRSTSTARRSHCRSRRNTGRTRIGC